MSRTLRVEVSDELAARIEELLRKTTERMGGLPVDPPSLGELVAALLRKGIDVFDPVAAPAEPLPVESRKVGDVTVHELAAAMGQVDMQEARRIAQAQREKIAELMADTILLMQSWGRVIQVSQPIRLRTPAEIADYCRYLHSAIAPSSTHALIVAGAVVDQAGVPVADQAPPPKVGTRQN